MKNTYTTIPTAFWHLGLDAYEILLFSQIYTHHINGKEFVLDLTKMSKRMSCSKTCVRNKLKSLVDKDLIVQKPYMNYTNHYTYGVSEYLTTIFFS